MLEMEEKEDGAAEYGKPNADCWLAVVGAEERGDQSLT